MNKLIPKLLDQAGLKPEIMLDDSSREVECFVTKYDGSVPSIENYTKLAELIVKETITEMCQQLYWHGEDQSNNPSFYKAIDKTKKHFGVEE